MSTPNQDFYRAKEHCIVAPKIRQILCLIALLGICCNFLFGPLA
jgi:hypothetical protein